MLGEETVSLLPINQAFQPPLVQNLTLNWPSRLLDLAIYSLVTHKRGNIVNIPYGSENVGWDSPSTTNEISRMLGEEKIATQCEEGLEPHTLVSVQPRQRPYRVSLGPQRRSSDEGARLSHRDTMIAQSRGDPMW